MTISSKLKTITKLRISQRAMVSDPIQIIQDPGLEWMFICALFQCPKDALDAAQLHGVTPLSFWREGHAEIFMAVVHVANQAREREAPVSPAIVLSELNQARVDTKGFQQSFDDALLNKLTATPVELAKALKAIEVKRSAQVESVQLAQDAHKMTLLDIQTKLSKVGDEVASNDGDIKTTFEGKKDHASFIDGLHGRYDEYQQGKPLRLLSTGLPDLDHAIGGGLRRGKVYNIAAHEKTGKSQLGCFTAASNLKKKDVFVDIYSVEMRYDDTMSLIFSSMSSQIAHDKGMKPSKVVPTTLEILDGRPWNEDVATRDRYSDWLGKGSYECLDHTENMRFKLVEGEPVEWIYERVRSRSQAWREQGGEGDYLVIIDYGQDLSTTSAHVFSDVKAQVRVSSVIRMMASVLDVTVLVVLHAGDSEDVTKEPGAKVYGSKQWLKDTEGCFMLWRPFRADGTPSHWMQIDVIRSRKGRGGKFQIKCDLSRGYFEPWAGDMPVDVFNLIHGEQEEEDKPKKKYKSW